MSHIFISYSKHNQPYARKLADHLLSQGFDVWIDDQIDYGDDWWRTIVRAIRGAKAFIVIMTDESDASDWVQREVTLADKSKIAAFPLWLSGDVDASENWAIYVRTQYADVRGEKLPGDDFTRRLEKVAPRKGGKGRDMTRTLPPQPAFEGWIPKMDKAEAPPMSDEETNKAVEQFRRNAAAIDKLKQQAILSDVSAILPPFEWCEIPAGKVTIEYSETDHKTFDAPQFWIAKYPITNAQYQVFVNAQDGYGDPAWWAYSDSAKVWRRDNKRPQKTAFEGGDLPRTNVTWYEAVAFCQWLTARIYPTPNHFPQAAQGVVITLPAEQQWQRAAQGDDKRIFPWGNEFDKTKCNTSESGIEKPTPVTQYPGGASPFGAMDMSGNIWEWCLTQHTTGQISLSGREHRIIRGGGWGHVSAYSQVVYRSASYPILKNGLHGFRVCAINPTSLPVQ
jgi:formylglycine-generating enzyme required for sulfatase activity